MVGIAVGEKSQGAVLFMSSKASQVTKEHCRILTSPVVLLLESFLPSSSVIPEA